MRTRKILILIPNLTDTKRILNRFFFKKIAQNISSAVAKEIFFFFITTTINFNPALLNKAYKSGDTLSVSKYVYSE